MCRCAGCKCGCVDVCMCAGCEDVHVHVWVDVVCSLLLSSFFWMLLSNQIFELEKHKVEWVEMAMGVAVGC